MICQSIITMRHEFGWKQETLEVRVKDKITYIMNNIYLNNIKYLINIINIFKMLITIILWILILWLTS